MSMLPKYFKLAAALKLLAFSDHIDNGNPHLPANLGWASEKEPVVNKSVNPSWIALVEAHVK